jgi:cytoskeletal protein CcmA (bactofilin family)
MANQSNPAGIIGRGLFIKGELHGEEDLIIEGRVEGEITLKKHLIIESTGVILADIQTENITIKGEMRGNMSATDKVTIFADARVVGDITAPRVVIEDGAQFKGHIEMAEVVHRSRGAVPEATAPSGKKGRG